MTLKVRNYSFLRKPDSQIFNFEKLDLKKYEFFTILKISKMESVLKLSLKPFTVHVAYLNYLKACLKPLRLAVNWGKIDGDYYLAVGWAAGYLL